MPTLRVAAAMLVGVWLAACTDWGAGPDITGATPSAVTIRYDSGKVKAAEADEAASGYCAGFDKAAKLRARFGNDPTMTYADYSCVAKAAKGD